MSIVWGLYEFKLLLNDYKFSEFDLKQTPIIYCLDKEIMKEILKKLNLIGNNEQLDIFDDYLLKINKDNYIERYNNLINKALNCFPKISNFYEILDVFAEDEWNNYKKENINDYANIFGKICIELKKNKNFDDVCNELDFLDEMELILEDKYEILLYAMKEYHSIMHGNYINKLSMIDKTRDTIANLASLYISICKENFKKDLSQEYFEDIKNKLLSRFNTKKLVR